MSGELKAQEDWAVVTPEAERRPRRKRQRKPLPATRRGLILHGLLRFLAIGAALAGGVVLIALGVVWLRGGSASRVIPLAFFVAAALLGAAALPGGMGTREPRGYWQYWQQRSEREAAFSRSFVYGSFALLMFAIAAVLDFEV